VIPNASPPRTARFAVSVFFVLNGGLFACWVSRIPAIQSSLGLSHSRLGLALLAAALGSLVAMPLAGWAIARLGSRRVTQLTAIGYCLALPLLALASNAAMLTGALFVYGALYGALDVAMNSQAVAVEERYGRPIMSFFHALFSLAGLVGAALGGLVAKAGIGPLAHFNWAALMIGGAMVLVAWPLLLTTIEHSTDLAQTEPRTSWTRPPAALLALGALAFCIMMGEGSMADWSAIYLRENGATEANAALGFAAFSIAMAAMRFLGDILSARLGAMRLVQVGGLFAAAGLGAALLIGGVTPALFGFAAAGLGFATIVPQVFSAAGRTAGMAPGPAIATATTIGYSGFLLGPPLIGFAADAVGLRSALFLIVGMSLAAVALAPALRPRGGVEI
jgi:MFS family permease